MFVKMMRRGYNRHGEQSATGLFLLAFSGSHIVHADVGNAEPTEERFEYKHAKTGTVRYGSRIFCCVRHVTMRQCGHWMVGRTRVGSYHFSLSGIFGDDGLPMDFRYSAGQGGDYEAHQMTSAEVKTFRDRWLTAMPDEIAGRYWSSSGHNEVGPTADEIRSWALANLDAMHHKRPSRGKKSST